MPVALVAEPVAPGSVGRGCVGFEVVRRRRGGAAAHRRTLRTLPSRGRGPAVGGVPVRVGGEARSWSGLPVVEDVEGPLTATSLPAPRRGGDPGRAADGAIETGGGDAAAAAEGARGRPRVSPPRARWRNAGRGQGGERGRAEQAEMRVAVLGAGRIGVRRAELLAAID